MRKLTKIAGHKNHLISSEQIYLILKIYQQQIGVTCSQIPQTGGVTPAAAGILLQKLYRESLQTATPQKIASDIYKAANKKKNVLFSLWMWKYIMMIITSIPEGMFKKMKM